MAVRQRACLGLLTVLLALVAGCAASPPRSGEDAAVGERVAAAAAAMIGKPYRYGGSSPSGFDCSGLVQFAHHQLGIRVPRTVEAQRRQAGRVPRNALRAGDLVFFRIEGKVSHVGLYVGDGRFVHAPSSGRRVMISRLDQPYWRQRLVRTGRFD